MVLAGLIPFSRESFTINVSEDYYVRSGVEVNVNDREYGSNKPYPWMSGWSYRKRHDIKGSTTGSLTNYQVNLTIYYRGGIDSRNKVYLNGKCRTDFGDVRFTKEDGTTLIDYWIEEKEDGNYAVFWIEVPLIPADPDYATTYIYYGKTSATTTSNGDATFRFFDHFTGTDVDLNKWERDSGSSGTYSVSGSVINLQLPKPEIGSLLNGFITKSTFTTPIRFRGYMKWVQYPKEQAKSQTDVYVWSYWLSKSNYIAFDFWASNPRENLKRRVQNNNYNDVLFDNTNYEESYCKLDMEITSTYITWRKDWSYWGGMSKSSSYNNNNNLLFELNKNSKSQNTADQCWVDYVFVTNWANPEPTHGYWGSEEFRYVPPSGSGGGWFFNDDHKNDFGFSVHQSREHEGPWYYWPSGWLTYVGRDFKEGMIKVKGYEIWRFKVDPVAGGWKISFGAWAEVDEGEGWEDG